MNMIMMLIIFTVIGFASIIMMCMFKGKMPPRIWNTAFIIADLVVFFFWNLAAYDLGWIDNDGWMTFENISPLCATLIPLTVFMNDKVKSYVYSFIAFLSVGLFAAMLLSPEYAYFFSYNIEATPIYAGEGAAHLICSLFGIYLVLSGQVKPDFKSWVRSLVCCFSLVGFGVFLNIFFHKTYFGMDPYGESYIYMLNIFDTHELTLLAYSMGVVLVLTIGMQVMRFLDVTTDLLHKETKIKDGISIAYHRIFDDDTEAGGDTPPTESDADRVAIDGVKGDVLSDSASIKDASDNISEETSSDKSSGEADAISK